MTLEAKGICISLVIFLDFEIYLRFPGAGVEGMFHTSQYSQENAKTKTKQKQTKNCLWLALEICSLTSLRFQALTEWYKDGRPGEVPSYCKESVNWVETALLVVMRLEIELADKR